LSGDGLSRFLAARVADGRTPGAAWWIDEPRRILSRGAVGHRVVEPLREPTSEDTPYDLASLTKPLVTAVLLVLFEQEGRLSLGMPASEFLPPLAGSWAGGATLLALATHSAGLPAWEPLYLGAATLDGYLERIAALGPAAEPGSTLYSDLGYIVLGAVLERVAGRGLDVLLRERIAEPLGLRRCGFATGRAAFGDAAATERGNHYERELARPAGASYAWRSRLLRGEVHDANAHGLGGVAGHAGLFATAGEVAAIAREWLEPRSLELGPGARARLLQPQHGDRTVGLVCARGSSAARGVLPSEAPGHTGFTGTSLWLDPGRGRVSVLLANRVHPRVESRDFQLVRRGFHRLAAGLDRR
jgi:CubicO group peptidase (beta-lactamase class C family)